MSGPKKSVLLISSLDVCLLHLHPSHSALLVGESRFLSSAPINSFLTNSGFPLRERNQFSLPLTAFLLHRLISRFLTFPARISGLFLFCLLWILEVLIHSKADLWFVVTFKDWGFLSHCLLCQRKWFDGNKKKEENRDGRLQPSKTETLEAPVV